MENGVIWLFVAFMSGVLVGFYTIKSKRRQENIAILKELLKEVEQLDLNISKKLILRGPDIEHMEETLRDVLGIFEKIDIEEDLE